jgi:hypothetical protein
MFSYAASSGTLCRTSAAYPYKMATMCVLPPGLSSCCAPSWPTAADETRSRTWTHRISVSSPQPRRSLRYSRLHALLGLRLLNSRRGALISVLIACMSSRVSLMSIAEALGPLIDRQQDVLHPFSDSSFRFGLRGPNGGCYGHLFSCTLCGLQVT